MSTFFSALSSTLLPPRQSTALPLRNAASLSPIPPAKRALDLLAASAGAVLFAPAWAAIATAIKLDDGGPVFFRQPRLGWRREPIDVLKFRTMREGAVTRVGRWLRPTGLDETAQFLNVLRGEMSMVGPRPLTAEDVQRLGWQDRSMDARWAVRPGITGFVQVLGSRSARQSRGFDRIYEKRQSARLDITLLAISTVINLAGKTRVREGIRTWRVWERMARRMWHRDWRECEERFRSRSARR